MLLAAAARPRVQEPKNNAPIAAYSATVPLEPMLAYHTPHARYSKRFKTQSHPFKSVHLPQFLVHRYLAQHQSDTPSKSPRLWSQHQMPTLWRYTTFLSVSLSSAISPPQTASVTAGHYMIMQPPQQPPLFSPSLTSIFPDGPPLVAPLLPPAV